MNMYIYKSFWIHVLGYTRKRYELKKTSEAMTSKAGGWDCEMYLKCIFFWIKSSVRYEHLNKNTFLMDKTSNVLLFNIHLIKVTFIYFFQLKKMATHSSTQMQSRSDMLRPSYWHHFRPGKSFQNSWKMAVDPKQTSIVKTFLFLLLLRARSRNSATLQIPGSFLGHFP